MFCLNKKAFSSYLYCSQDRGELPPPPYSFLEKFQDFLTRSLGTTIPNHPDIKAILKGTTRLPVKILETSIISGNQIWSPPVIARSVSFRHLSQEIFWRTFISSTLREEILYNMFYAG